MATQKWFHVPLVMLSLMFILASCRKDNNNVFKGSGTGIGAVKPEGNALESPKTSVIGAGGGTLISKDGKLKVTIPPGALSSNTTIGVAAINGTSDAALGNSYRLTPHMNFAKPVSITVSYKEHQDSAGGCGPGIGFQDSSGVWQIKVNKTLNEELKTVSIETNHFSDWALLTPFRILPTYSIIQPNDEVFLKLGAYVKIAPLSKDACDFKNTGNPDHVAIEEYYIVPNDGILNWISLAGDTLGAGKLTVLEKGVSYKATNFDAPPVNPVKILALFSKSRVPYQATIQVRPVKPGLSVTIENVTYVYEKAYAYGTNQDAGVLWEKNVGNRTFYGGLSWRNPKPATWQWSDDTQFIWEPEGDGQLFTYQSYWDDGMKASSGELIVTRFGKLGEIVEGTFRLSNAGFYKSATENEDLAYVGTKVVNGSFRVIRK